MARPASTRTGDPAPRTKPALERLLKIHAHLRDGIDAAHLRAGSPVRKNAAFFARELEVSAKTVHRDLEYMRDTLGLPLEYDAAQYTYYYAKAVSEFPLIKITEGELTALFLAKAALHQYKGSPYAGAIKSALAKLEDALKSDMAVDIDAMSRAISFRNAGSPVLDEPLFERLADAVMHRRVVSFDYQKPGASAPERRTVHPYHLTHYGTRWYLIAHDEARGEERQFVFSRIAALRVTARTFPAPSGFSAERYYQNAFGIFVSDGDHEAVIRFDPSGAAIVREGDWHPTQRLTELPGGRVELRLRVSAFDELAGWVLSFSGRAEVVAPPALRAQVRDLAAGLAERHR